MSLTAGSQFWFSGRSSFLVTHFLVRHFQGGFIPTWSCTCRISIRSQDCRRRLLFLHMPLCQYFCWLPAICLVRLNGVRGHPGWR
ncbi:hypothetical protein BS47DRAFT_441074 [Hydnum rufescens UP504]|uniref:Uncharacterized protein n=1 Tax=Hydnum rufescens UP504 TaxID=1448309 RepID=A0A9P6B4W9_9AGAM|nr:hypothetical protein BS47DRAFT_441074 [Hydnum rufescens UP504]